MKASKSVVAWKQTMYEAELILTTSDELDEELERLINEDKDFDDYESFRKDVEDEVMWANAEVIDVEIIDTESVLNPEEDIMCASTNEVNRMEIRVIELLNAGMSVRDISDKVNMKIKKVQTIVDNYRLNNKEEEAMDTNVNVEDNNKKEESNGFFSFISSVIGGSYNAVKNVIGFVMDSANSGLKASVAGLAALGAFLGLDFGLVSIVDPTGATAGFVAALTSFDAILFVGLLSATVLFAYYVGSLVATRTTVSNQ